MLQVLCRVCLCIYILRKKRENRREKKGERKKDPNGSTSTDDVSGQNAERNGPKGRCGVSIDKTARPAPDMTAKLESRRRRSCADRSPLLSTSRLATGTTLGSRPRAKNLFKTRAVMRRGSFLVRIYEGFYIADRWSFVACVQSTN